jgi:prepilin-type N-terminal cleavage/methylation domain-containing protein
MQRLAKRQHMRRAGFSLTEVVVAITLLALGALGAASTTAFTARLMSSAVAIDLATRAVARMIDSLRVVPCPALSSGSSAALPGLIVWRITRSPSVTQLDVTLTPRSSRLAAPVIAQTVVACE